MKWIGVLVWGVALVHPVSAADVAGKWGVGAGVFAGGGEVSLIRGHSQRTAWLFEVQVSGNSENYEAETITLGGVVSSDYNRNSLSVGVGPGLRRYTRPSSEFSPYFDVSIGGVYRRFHESGSTSNAWGASAAFDFGLEYFTKWGFSVAAHTPVTTVSWVRDKRVDGNFVQRSSEIRADVGVRPSLFVRGYF
jgi:hypothetical protein